MEKKHKLTQYKDDLAINLNDLHHEWIEQPHKFMKYAKLWVIAKRKRKKKHQELKVCRSELTIEKKIETPKATQTDIEAFYRTHEKHMKLAIELIDLEYYEDYYEQAMWAFVQRKTALEEEVKLWEDEYFSTPSNKRSIRDGKKSGKQRKAIQRKER